MTENLKQRFWKKKNRSSSFLAIASFCFFIGGICGCSHAHTSESHSETHFQKLGPAEIGLPQEAVEDGGVFALTILGPCDLEIIATRFQDHDIEIFRDLVAHSPAKEKPCVFKGLVGVDFGTAPGKVPLHFILKSDKNEVKENIPIEIKSGNYPSEKLTVPPRTVKPSAKDKKQIEKDHKLISKAYATKSFEKFWNPPTVLPVNSIITSVYGTSRIYNGVKSNVHFGTDLRAPTGTPIVSPINGKVVLAHKLFYTGNTVILDHGFGLFSIYAHMSKLKVKLGRRVKKGQTLGLSGMTGRANGPHLHWGINLHGTKVDPMKLIKVLNAEK